METLPWDMIGAIFGGLSFLLTIFSAWPKLGIWRRIIIAFVVGVSVFMVIKSIPTIFPSQISTAASETPFTGIWEGIDPSDGSVTTISLTQTGDVLTGRYNDSYSGDANPPGWHGEGSGTILSPTTAHITFYLSRWDGDTGNFNIQFTISDGYNSMMVNNCIWKNEIDPAGCPMVMQRQ